MASAPPFKVKAVYEYSSPHEDDLSFPNGQIINVAEEEDADWYIGNYIDASGSKHDGLFPKNFVEKFEPEAPPRPTRTRTKRESTLPATENEPEPVSHEQIPEPVPDQAAIPDPAPTPKKAPAPVLPPAKIPEPKEEPTPTATKVAPPVSEKPSSFKDRIAAFNKGSAAPVAPIKPGPLSSGGAGFIKKPFVPPPPARDAYVPPPRELAPPVKVYRREEDPEIVERQQQDLEDAEKSGLTASNEAPDAGEEEVRTTTLKERIALLQKQQQEQAARRADVSQKEKPKKPLKRLTDPIDAPEPALDELPEAVEETPQHPPLERLNSSESRVRQSIDSTRENSKPSPSGRRPSREPRASMPEMVSDGNEADQSGAGETTEDGGASSTEVEDIADRSRAGAPTLSRTSTANARELNAHGGTREEAEADSDEEEDESDSMDEETRRKQELRERMAKMSGGMGMPGMFSMAAPSTAAPRKKRSSANDDQRDMVQEGESAVSPPSAPRVPMIPIPGMSHVQSPEPRSPVGREDANLPSSIMSSPGHVDDTAENENSQPARPSNRVVPSIPQDRPLPPPPTTRPGAPPVPSGRPVSAAPDARPPPPAPPSHSRAPQDLDNEDETISSRPAIPIRSGPPPIPGTSLPPRPDGPRSPPPVPNSRTSYIEETTPDKRQSRAIPTIPSMPPAPVAESRPPPPPPPTAAPPARQSSGEQDDEGESDYEGDYDTDIASGADHKNALNTVQEKGSDDNTTLSGSPIISHQSPLILSQREVPPPPSHQIPITRLSGDVPRGPPPPPPQRGIVDDDPDYDPYSYNTPQYSGSGPGRNVSQSYEPLQQASDPSLYGEPESERSLPPMPAQFSGTGNENRGPPPPPPGNPRTSKEQSRKSLEVPRQSMNQQRSSMDQSRTSMSIDLGQIAQDVDLAQNSVWWSQPNTPPPVFQGRNDVLCEFEDSQTSKRGGRTTISRDVYVLFQDHSQTIVTARFDSRDLSDVSLEQRHEPPPARLRQDQLEEIHSRFGAAIVSAATAVTNTVVGDGSAQALVLSLISAQQNALLPVGTRAYGALVYANMANATVQQFDEIRPGDIISFRNAKFSGKHGPMHAKYSEDVGKPDHVAVVVEWDGTKKKVRALEQGRDSKKVKVESHRVGDLKSGDVRVWRVMDRKWVGWE